ncbi:MAG TPA: glycosyltransferase 87 family protein, partial [Thermoanaerobaculia bacterium]|nr:glycosyltransferase 87 family protein [Thermoanaerobaculia bacterium]
SLPPPMPAARTRIALVAIACCAFLVRVAFLVGHGGPLASPTDYDDGVYFAASALLVRGVLPYRDFVFVHPPGVAWVYALVSWWRDPAHAFAVARVLACVVGAVNTWLVGRIVLRSGSAVAALLAAAMYALYPDVVNVERSTYLEPLLNLACLASAFVWLSDEERPMRAGLLAGAACAIKVLGGIWVVAALATPRSARSFMRFLIGGIIAGVVLLAPLALIAPRSFFEDVIRFQLTRPPDGTLGAALRVPLIFGAQPAAALLAAVALIALFVQRTRAQRFFAIATLLTVAAFFASSSYWIQYNSYLAASECVLAGLGIAALVQWRPALTAVAIVVTAALLVAPARWIVAASQQRANDAIALRRVSRAITAPLFAFDPSWGLVAGHLPPHGDGAPVIVDSYGAMLLEATRSGKHFADTNAAFRETASQPAVRARLAATPYVIAGWRGNWQLPDADRAWMKAHFFCITPEAGDLCVMQRLAQPFDGLVRASGPVTFGEGWYAEEGRGADAWRWMGARGVIILPPIDGTARLVLEMNVPQGSPTVTVSADGRVLDRVAATGSLIRSYSLNGHVATVTLETSKTFVPGPNDARALGLMLRRLVWLGDADARAMSSPP